MIALLTWSELRQIEWSTSSESSALTSCDFSHWVFFKRYEHVVYVSSRILCDITCSNLKIIKSILACHYLRYQQTLYLLKLVNKYNRKIVTGMDCTLSSLNKQWKTI